MGSACALGVLIVAVYFTATSSLFITKVIMPGAVGFLHAQVSAQAARLSPFSSLDLNEFALGPPGGEPFLRADEIHARYNLRRILNGEIAVQSLTLVSPRIHLVCNPDGSWNVDPWLASLASKPDGPRLGGAQTAPSAPTLLSVGNVRLTNAWIEIVFNQTNGAKQTLTLSGVDLALDKLVTAQPGSLVVALAAKLANSEPGSQTEEVFEGAIDATMAFSLDPKFMPKFIRGILRLDLQTPPARLKSLAGASLILEADLTPVLVSKLNLRLVKGNAPLARINVTGPFDARRGEGRLAVDLSGVDRRFLAAAGGLEDYNFNDTELGAHNDLEFREGGSRINATGVLRAARLSVTGEQTRLTTPVVDVALAYGLKINTGSQSALVEKLEISGREDGAPVLTTTLSQPMTVSWGAGAQAPENALLAVAVTGFDFARWRLLTRGFVSQGRLNAALRLSSREGQKHLATDLTAQFQDLTAMVGTNEVSKVDVDLRLDGRLENLVTASLKNYRVAVSRENSNAIVLEGSGRYNLKSRAGSGSAVLTGSLPGLLNLAPAPGIEFSSGGFRVDAQVEAKRFAQQVSATATFTNVTGRAGPATVNQAGATALTVARLRDKTLSIQQFEAKIDQSGISVLTVDLQGSHSLVTGGAEAQISLEAPLTPLQQAFSVPGVRLDSGSMLLKGKLAASADSQSFAGLIELSGVSGNVPGAFLKQVSVALDADVHLHDRALSLNKLDGTITASGKPGGKFNLAGVYYASNNTARAKLGLAGLNQETLAPFIDQVIGDLNLQTAVVDAQSSAEIDDQGHLAILSDLDLVNVVFQTAKSRKTNPPVSGRLHLDGRFNGWLLDLRELSLQLPPSPRAENLAGLRGRLDFSENEVMSGTIDLNASSLDLSPWLEPASTGATNQPSAHPPTAPPLNHTNAVEPAVVFLPFDGVRLDTKISRLYVGGVQATNFHAVIIARTNSVIVDALSLSLDGAPVEASGSMDFSTPGYRYQAVLRGENVPLAPIMDTFNPEDRGKLQGALTIEAAAQGAGFLPASFRRNLTGDLSLSYTNAGIQVMGKKLQLILLPVSLVLRIPEIIRSPLVSLDGRFLMTNANVTVERIRVDSAAFAGRTSGSFQLGDIPGEAPLRSWPVEFMLARPLARRADLMPANTPTNAVYVALPVFLKLKGTLADPKLDISELGIARILVSSTTGILTKPAGALLKAAEQLVKGAAGRAKTNAPPAQGVSTNRPPPPN